MLIKTVAIAAVLIFTVFADEQPKWGGNFEPSNTDYLSLESNNPIGQGSQSTNETNVTNDELETVVDTILTSSRQGRNLDGFDEVYSDPNVQEVLQKGDDRQARNVIKDKLCSLGLMDCEGEQIEGKRPFLPPGELIYSQPPPGYRKPNGPPNHYGPPRPMPPPNGNGNNFGPPRKVGYAYSPQQTFQTTQSFPGPVYHSKPPGPVYVDSKPPGPIYEGSLPPGPIYQGPKPPGPIFSGESGSPYKFENVVENFHSHGKYEVSGHEFQGPAKPTIVVNAQGGAATTGQTAASSVNIHHHYHHIDEGASKTPVVVNNPIPVPVPQLISGNAISSSSEFSSNSGGFSPLSSGYDYNKIKQGSSYSGAQFNGVNSGLGPVNGLSGSGVYGGGVKPVFEQTNSIGQSGYGSFDVGSSYTGNGQFGHTASGNYGGSNSQFGQSVSGVYNGNTESFHSSNPGYYKKALNTNGGTNSLSYSQSGYKQQFGQFGASGTGESYQGFDSNRQDNFDCVCVPYDQCPSVDIIGRKGDLILPLDPRNLKTDIEAVDEETVTITDGNGTMTVVRVPKDTVDNTNATNANSTNTTVAQDAPKKITKRDVSEKKADVQEKADGEARQAFYQQRPQQCGPSQVCCRRPIRQQKQNFGQCGRRNTNGITGRIKNPVYVDGDSEFGEYPWQVAILKKDPKESVYICGGTLIDHQHIITAAHCVKTYTSYDLRVRLGEWDVNHDVEFFPYIERDVTNVIVHPEYYAGTLDNDLAILRLNVPVDFANAPHISPACLPDKFSDYTGHRCWTTGWGKDAFGDFGKYQNILKEVDVPIINQQQCQQQLRNTRLGYSYKLNPGFICAGGEEGKDACKGDGGGPMVCERNGSWQLVGVVSWGIGCGQVNVPGVYVRVSHYLDWIHQVTRGF